MRIRTALIFAITASLLMACNKSSPPPQEPVKPRGVISLEMPIHLPAP